MWVKRLVDTNQAFKVNKLLIVHVSVAWYKRTYLAGKRKGKMLHLGPKDFPSEADIKSVEFTTGTDLLHLN